jgi:hypothetical protein
MINRWKKYELDSYDQLLEMTEEVSNNNIFNSVFIIGIADNEKWMVDVLYKNDESILTKYDDYLVEPTIVQLEQIDEYKWN